MGGVELWLLLRQYAKGTLRFMNAAWEKSSHSSIVESDIFTIYAISAVNNSEWELGTVSRDEEELKG
jgi:hypothetical protein